MKIRMYNCYFGDCFRIANENKDENKNELLVDFGISTYVGTDLMRKNRFDDVVWDIRDVPLDFLLSHYHEDHFNGAIYAMDRMTFSDIYIPDVWSKLEYVNAANIILLRVIVGNALLKLKTGEVPLFCFLRKLCGHNVVFVSQGTKIQDRFIALWPNEDFLIKQSKEIFDKTLKESGLTPDQQDEFRSIVDDTTIVVNSIGEEALIRTNIDTLNQLEERVRRFSTNIDPTVARKLLIPLNNFGNDISIVFHNKEDSPSENCLFLGDFGRTSDLWNSMLSSVNLYDYYHVIKVGHHGTRKYYKSFTQYITENSIFLIPNGTIARWSTDARYSLNAIMKNAKVICSNCCDCDAYNSNIIDSYGNKACTCYRGMVIGSSKYKDII